MNYTTNYHLPQWDEEDRIMRTDFNRMCADIDAGLSGSAREAETLRQDGRKTMDRFCRMAYNHYCMVQCMNPAPDQIGLFYQNFERDPSGLTGTLAWNGRQFAGKSSVKLTNEMVAQCHQTIEPMHMVKDDLAASTPMKASFTPPVTGYVNNYYIQGGFSDCTPNTDVHLRINLINQETGGVEHSVIATITNEISSGGFSYHTKAPLYFLGGVEYLITMQPLEAVCNMNADLRFTGSGIPVASYTNEGIVTANTAIHESTGGMGGMAVIRCVIGGEGGDLTFHWDGVERQPDITRIAKMSDGQAFHEFVYIRSDDIPGNSNLSLRFECRQEGNILLHDWGVVLF